jgi:hypothetical protein
MTDLQFIALAVLACVALIGVLEALIRWQEGK